MSNLEEETERLTDAVAELVKELLTALDGFAWAGRRLHPPVIDRLAVELAQLEPGLRRALDSMRELGWPEHVREQGGRLEVAAETAVTGLGELEEAATSPNGVFLAYRALRRNVQALEVIFPLCGDLPSINHFFLEAEARSSPLHRDRVLARADPDGPATGILRGGRDILRSSVEDPEARGGFSLYVPEFYDPEREWPLVVALHGGSGSGPGFLWSWLREARTRGFLLLSPTSQDRTWSLLQPSVDSQRIEGFIEEIAERWQIDREHILLTGMSDGGTFALLAGLSGGTPYTHLAPISGVLPPLDPERQTTVRDRRIYLVHGALDWMFPVQTARMAASELERLGADLTFREIEDLSHTYPRDENPKILEWFDSSLALGPDSRARDSPTSLPAEP